MCLELASTALWSELTAGGREEIKTRVRKNTPSKRSFEALRSNAGSNRRAQRSVGSKSVVDR